MCSAVYRRSFYFNWFSLPPFFVELACLSLSDGHPNVIWQHGGYGEQPLRCVQKYRLRRNGDCSRYAGEGAGLSRLPQDSRVEESPERDHDNPPTWNPSEMRGYQLYLSFTEVQQPAEGGCELCRAISNKVPRYLDKSNSVSMF
jgi:hypothetical protein